jgi:hypothetical protein
MSVHQELLPDVYVEKTSDNQMVVVVANKKARRLLNKSFDGNPPRWAKMADDNVLTSPEYRAIEVGGSDCIVAAMVCCVHAAGFRAMFWCEDCRDSHLVDDAMAKTIWAIAIAGSVGALPEHATLQ